MEEGEVVMMVSLAGGEAAIVEGWDGLEVLLDEGLRNISVDPIRLDAVMRSETTICLMRGLKVIEDSFHSDDLVQALRILGDGFCDFS